MPKRKLDKIQKVRTTEQELEVLARLKDSVEWAVAKRVGARYVENLKKASFKLLENDPHYLAIRHADFAGQAFGIKVFVKMIENSGKKLEKLEKER